MPKCFTCQREREQYQMYYSTTECWTCARRAYKAKWRKENKDYMPNWRKENKTKYNEYFRNRYATEPEFREKRIVRTLGKANKIQHHLCEKCGSDNKIEAHHLDYAKPLELVWLCKKCHTEEHSLCRTVNIV